MAATILETIAAYAKERAARDKEKVPEKEHLDSAGHSEKRNVFYL